MKWPITKLDDIAVIRGGSTPKRNTESFWNGDIAWVTPTDLPMPGERIADVFETKEKITDEGLKSISAQLLEPGTVLFSSRASIGKIGIARIPLVTNQGFANFTPKPGLDSKYLAYCLQQFTSEITQLAGSTTFKEVSRGSIKNFKIPLPPISEQRRIVEILDQADALRKKRKEADEKAARILPALFYKMFGDPATNPKGWPSLTISELLTLEYGKALPKAIRNNSGLYAVAGSNGPDGRHEAFIVEGPGVVVGRKGSAGETTWYDDSFWPIDTTYYVQLKINASMKWVYFLLKTLDLKRHSTQTGVPGLNRNDVYNLHAYFPPIEYQLKFEKIASSIEENISNSLQSRFHVDKVFQTLLHNCFTGELTKKWRNAHMQELLHEMELQAKCLNQDHAN
jgi:type I restriction enzyme S subunit